MEYLALPFTLHEGYLDRADLEQSITYSIGIIIGTRPGTMSFNREFGCAIWDKEYSDIFSSNKADLRSGVRNAIDRFERRLFNVSVSILKVESQAGHPLGMVVKVTGNYKLDNNEERKFEARYKLG